MIRAYVYGDVVEDRAGLGSVLGMLIGITCGTLLATWSSSQGLFAPVPQRTAMEMVPQRAAMEMVPQRAAMEMVIVSRNRPRSAALAFAGTETRSALLTVSRWSLV
jgi:hypothetical protein